MKIVLIVLNCLFACGITWGVLSSLGKPSMDEDEYFIKRKPGKKSAVKKAAAKKNPAKMTAPQNRSSAEKEQIIVSKNVFDAARCPNARVFGRRRNNNTRLSMTLVGTFTIDKVSGAIILQKQQQNRPNMPPWMAGRANMNQNNNWNRGGNMARQRFMPGMFPGQNNNNQQQESVVYKQYVRVGETMANGYKLDSVTRNSAVLTKGSERMELTIVEASKNAGGKSNTTNQNRNPFQMNPQQMRQWMWMMNNRGNRNMNWGNRGNWNQQNRNRR
ncbi:MAG: hypothetical protein IKB16_03810 [Lentisphaeria bacterium]|nr:hypothetical protein [Lentisphaeria bacterium]